MKLRVPSIIFVALVLCCLGTVHAKPQVQVVRASKKDDRPITIEITDSQGNILSKATFKKNTYRFTKSLRLVKDLHFDWSKGDNTITAYYNDDPKNGFGILVSENDAPRGSEIVIDNNTIYITNPSGQRIVRKYEKEITSLIPSGSLESLSIPLRIEKGTWFIVTGDIPAQVGARALKDYLRPDIRRNVSKVIEEYPAVLDIKEGVNPSCNTAGECKVRVYRNRPTKVYTNLANTTQRKWTLLNPVMIDDPILFIDAQGKAKIMGYVEYESLAKKKSALAQEAATYLNVPLKVESGVWNLVTAKDGITAETAQQALKSYVGEGKKNAEKKYPTIIDVVLDASPGCNENNICAITVHKDSITKLYAYKANTPYAKITQLSFLGIDDPILLIEAEGSAIIMKRSDYEAKKQQISSAVVSEQQPVTPSSAPTPGVVPSKQTDIEILREKLTQHAGFTDKEREKNPIVMKNANLVGADLQAADLTNAHLEGAKLTDADLRGAILIKARLSKANLDRVRLDNANLYGVHLEGAHLSNAVLNKARLLTANLEGANLQETDFMSANLQGANLANAQLEGANLLGADLRGAHLEGANLDASFIEAKLEGAHLAKAQLQNANLYHADLRKANLIDANLTGANLIGAVLEGANLSGANLTGANLEGAVLEGANLEGAVLEGANLEGAVLEGANLNKANLNRAKLHKANLHNASLRLAVLRHALLTQANLQNADLTANLEGANLQNADLRGADLTGAVLMLAHLEKANLQKAKLNQAQLYGIYLANAQLQNAALEDAYLTNAHLESAHLEGANLTKAKLTNAHLEGAHLEGANLTNTNLEDADLTNAHLEGANLTLAFLMNTKLEGANLQNAIGLSAPQKEYATKQGALQVPSPEIVPPVLPAIEQPTFIEATPPPGAAEEASAASVEEDAPSSVVVPSKQTDMEKLHARLLQGGSEPVSMKGAQLQGARLDHVQLKRAYLEGADLTGADLSYANLSGANLSNAILEGTNVQNTNFSNVNFSGAYFKGVKKFETTTLSGAILDGALGLTDVQIEHVKAQGVSAPLPERQQRKIMKEKREKREKEEKIDAEKLLTQRAEVSSGKRTRIEMPEAILRSLYLANANLRDAVLTSSDLTYANLSKADLTGAQLQDAKLEKANLSDANLTNANLKQSQEAQYEKGNTALSRANLSRAILRGANLTNVNFHEADLTGVVGLETAILEGAVVSKAKGLTPEQIKLMQEKGALGTPLSE